MAWFYRNRQHQRPCVRWRREKFVKRWAVQEQLAIDIKNAPGDERCLAKICYAPMHRAPVGPHGLGNGVRIKSSPSPSFPLPLVWIARCRVCLFFQSLDLDRVFECIAEFAPVGDASGETWLPVFQVQGKGAAVYRLDYRACFSAWRRVRISRNMRCGPVSAVHWHGIKPERAYQSIRSR